MATKNIVLGVENRLGLTSAGVTDWLQLNNKRTGNYPIGIFISTDGLTSAFECTVEYTARKNPETAPVNAIKQHKYLKNLNELSDPDDLDGNFTVPVSAVRLNVSSITGGELFLSVIQSGV